MDIKGRPKDKQSSTGISGSPKKGGAGGKGTWGVGGMDDLKAVAIADNRDPNYDSEDEEVEDVVIAKTEVISPVEVLIQEFLASGDINESIKSLKELNIEHLHEQYIRKSMIRSMEKQAFERELVSKLLVALYNVVVKPENISKGFQAALNSLDDIVIDIPDGTEMLAKFLARAIIDEIVPPVFLKHAECSSRLAEHCIASANALLNQPFRSERLAHIWGAGDLSSVKRLKEEGTMIIEEYLTNDDLHEADQSIRQLNARNFHPQLVKLALKLALTKEEKERKRILHLLSSVSKSDLISADHMEMGFRYCAESLEDIKLDVPNAGSLFTQFIQIAKDEGWLTKAFAGPKAQ